MGEVRSLHLNLQNLLEKSIWHQLLDPAFPTILPLKVTPLSASHHANIDLEHSNLHRLEIVLFMTMEFKG